jgi:phosphoribosylglycinamide formyltransferase 1
MMQPAIIIFASGTGSNAIAIHQHAMATQQFTIACIVSNKADAGILQYALQRNIPTIIISKQQFNSTDFLSQLQPYSAKLLVLAGFLWLVPSYLIQAYTIVNIHPSLLPKYGGAGMYGQHVHEAVVANRELQTGITVHLVNEQYDDGKILLQKSVRIEADDDASIVAKKVLALEHDWYKIVISNLLEQ